jgi:hypothetical protein
MFLKQTHYIQSVHIARIALTHKDLPEFNQCQSRLQELKLKGVPISEDEFNCYSILHALYQDNNIELVPFLRKIFAYTDDASTPVNWIYAYCTIRTVVTFQHRGRGVRSPSL